MAAPAGFWRRYAAYSVDATVLAMLALPILWSPLQSGQTAVAVAYGHLQKRMEMLLGPAAAGAGDPFALALSGAADPELRATINTVAEALTHLSLLVTVVVFGLAAVYFIASESSAWQASPGKRLLGVRVTDLSGGRPSPGRIAVRFLSGVMSWLLLNLGHALAAWTPDKRALHDYLAGTRVELAPGASVAMPRWALAWLWLQAGVAVSVMAVQLLHYTQWLSQVIDRGP